MANSDTRFIYANDDGGICIVTPADNTDLTLDQIKDKDCPSGKTVYTVDNLQFQQIGVSEMLGLTRSKTWDLELTWQKPEKFTKQI